MCVGSVYYNSVTHHQRREREREGGRRERREPILGPEKREGRNTKQGKLRKSREREEDRIEIKREKGIRIW